MSSIVFGTGVLCIGETQVGIVESATIDQKGTLKTLQGGSEFPIASAVTGRTLSGKISFRDLDYALIASLQPGATTTTGSLKAAVNEAGVLTSSVHTKTVTNSATFDSNGGVIGPDGRTMTKVAATPAVGQYSVAAGVYTFHADEIGTVRISYFYTSTGGSTVAVANRLAQVSPTFVLKLFTNDDAADSFGIKVYAATIPSLTIALASEDFAKQDLEWSAQQDSAGKIYDLYY